MYFHSNIYIYICVLVDEKKVIINIQTFNIALFAKKPHSLCHPQIHTYIFLNPKRINTNAFNVVLILADVNKSTKTQPYYPG